MKKLMFVLGLLVPFAVSAALIHGKDSSNNDQVVRVNSSGQITQTLQAGEDQTNGVQKVEGQFSYKICTADCQISAAAGFVHTITCATPAGAAVAAGAITLRNAATETTPIVATIGIPNTAFVPFTLVLDTVLPATGMYLAWDGTAGAVSCTVSYR